MCKVLNVPVLFGATDNVHNAHELLSHYYNQGLLYNNVQVEYIIYLKQHQTCAVVDSKNEGILKNLLLIPMTLHQGNLNHAGNASAGVFRVSI